MTTALSEAKRPSFSQFVQAQGKTLGLFKDMAKCFKLVNFWTQCLTGSITESSQKMTLAGRIIGNYSGIWELPRRIDEIKISFQNLKTDEAKSIAGFASAVFGTGKSFFDGIDLVGSKFGLLSSKVVNFFSPLNPMGTLAYATHELIFKNIPSIQKNWTEDSKQVHSSLLKLIKHVALTAIGFLTLIAAFFKPICSLWMISTLSTISVVSSISGHFFDALTP